MNEFIWIFAERSDTELAELKMKYEVEKSEHDSRLHILNQLLSDIEKEQDMRKIAGSHAELTHFRQRTRNQRKGHCNHAPKCIGKGDSDERDPFGCCNCGTRRKEQEELLASLERQFEEQGGRGVELADRIDELREELGEAEKSANLPPVP